MAKKHSNGDNARHPFTDYLVKMDRDEEPDAALAEDVWKGLRRLLRRVLSERGLWQRSPSFLGIVGWGGWQEGSSRDGRREDALEELTLDAYVFIFTKRAASLLAQLQHKPQIEGLVALNIRHFVHDRQQRHDALGRRVYTVLCDAAECAVEAGELHCSPSEGRVRGGSVLTFEAVKKGIEPNTDPDAIEEIVRRWNDHLIPTLVTATGTGYARLLNDVRAAIGTLPDLGVQAFRLADVSRPLARDLRARWWSLLDTDAPRVTGRDTATDSPRQSFEAREHFEALAERVERAIEEADHAPDARWLMAAIWRLLIGWADEGGPSCAGHQPAAAALVTTAGAPSQRAIGRALGVSRGRVATAYERLEGIVRRCRAQLASRRGPQRDAAGHVSTFAITTNMDPQNTRTLLHQRAFEAVASARRERQAMTFMERRTGDVFVARGAAEGCCEWVIVEMKSEPDTVLVVPADTSCVAGRDSLVIGEDEPGGPLTLRCGLARWIDRSRLVDLPSRQLAEEAVDAARRLVEAAASEAESVPEWKTDAEGDPDHRAWLSRLRAEADTLASD